MTYLLTEAWFTVLTLRAVDERGGLRVEAMQTIRVLVHERVILRDELPADFGGVHGRVGHGDTTDEATTRQSGSPIRFEQHNTYREGRGRGQRGRGRWGMR